MSVFESESFDDHEQVVFCSDRDSGLKAIIAIHSTAVGPGAGGCRMWPYASEEEALRDVLRLSRGMSYKNVLAGVGLGGGKSVIIGDSKTQKTPELLRAFGRYIEALGGRYITAEDMGMSPADLEIVATQTKYVAGRDKGQAASGDPSPFTAHGVFSGIRASVKQRLGTDDLKGMRVAVQGLGKVGYNLCRELSEAGAELIVSDINPESVARCVEEFDAVAVDPAEILSQNVDVLAPCAMGAIFDDASIPTLTAKVIAGGANNQLAEARHGAVLRDLGILYAPDYVINSGGIISVANEVHNIVVSHEEGMKRVENVYDILTDIFAMADKKKLPTSDIADEMAKTLIREAKAGEGQSHRAA
ncbi:MAG: Glu/Leu/Phe/Val dehydrogenase dimerization domain-containing protein [Sphingomonadales bacterium]